MSEFEATVEETEEGLHRWVLRDADGEVAFTSFPLGDYETADEARKGGEEAAIRARFRVYEIEATMMGDGSEVGWYWQEADAAGEVLAGGGPYPTAVEAGKAVNAEAEARL